MKSARTKATIENQLISTFSNCYLNRQKHKHTQSWKRRPKGTWYLDCLNDVYYLIFILHPIGWSNLIINSEYIKFLLQWKYSNLIFWLSYCAQYQENYLFKIVQWSSEAVKQLSSLHKDDLNSYFYIKCEHLFPLGLNRGRWIKSSWKMIQMKTSPR